MTFSQIKGKFSQRKLSETAQSQKPATAGMSKRTKLYQELNAINNLEKELNKSNYR